MHNNMTTRHSPDYMPRKRKRGRRRTGKFKDTHYNKFMENQILMDGNNRDACNHIVQRIGNILKNNVMPQYRPAEVIKAGSRGKGTDVKNSSDIDIVFLLGNNFTTIEQFEKELNNILEDISATLRQQHYNVIGKTSKAVQVRVDCNAPGTGIRHTIDVDILPAVNKEKYNMSAIIAQMESSDPSVRKFFTPSVTKWQRDFVKDSPAKLKHLIRFVKDWKDKTIKNAPSSYCFELMIKHLWVRAGSPNDFAFESALGLVMQELSSSSSFQIEFDNFYDREQRQRHNTPYIIDPVNPYSNVMEDCKSWREVENRAQEYINRNINRDISRGFIPI